MFGRFKNSGWLLVMGLVAGGPLSTGGGGGGGATGFVVQAAIARKPAMAQSRARNRADVYDEAGKFIGLVPL
jgi:hypothetical protein